MPSGAYDYPDTFADALGPHVAGSGLRRGDGLALLRWLLDPVGVPEMSTLTSAIQS
jgi:hypothetical protein